MRLKAGIERRIQSGHSFNNAWSDGLRIASGIYGLGARIRGWFFDRGVLKSRRLPCPVISVGNLSVGGTGKTPLVVTLARILSASGRSVAILSRGYRRKNRRPIQLVSDGTRPLCTVEQAGDEPFMMSHRLEGVRIWVGPDRYRVGLEAWERHRPDIFLLDDGFQHRRLFRDLDIVILRGLRCLRVDQLLPRGPLREPPSALRRAHILVVNTSDTECDSEDAINEAVKLAPSVPIHRAVFRPKSLWQISDGEEIPLGTLKGLKVAVACAVGHPQGFIKTLEGLGARISHLLSFPDHYWYTPQDIECIHRHLQSTEAVITTEKDAWKILNAARVEGPVWVLSVDLEIDRQDAFISSVEGFLASFGRPL